ncbi:MAG: hypothetical protein WCT12_26880 [Verrucomicrobiota bacterium]
MKNKFSAAAATKRRKELLAACDTARQRCNKLTDEERQKLLEEGLHIIYGSDAEAQARCR